MQKANSGRIHAQRGMTFWSTLVVLASIVLLGTIGLKVLPAYLEFNAVRTEINKLGRDNAGDINKKDVAIAFDKQASVDNIESIKGSDLIVNGNVITAEYQKVIPFVGNLSILLDFKASTSK